MLGYDGASPFSLADAKQHSGIVITGYLVGHPGGYDPVDKPRVNQIRALGMGFLPNWERAADYLVSCGKAGGVKAGQEALAAMRSLGVPDDGTVACPFSWDVNVAPGLYSQCGQVADGIVAGLAGHYLFSAYGQGGLIDYFRGTGRMKVKGWLSGSTSFPGFNASGPNIAMVQSHDAQGNWINTQVPGTDVNTVIDPRALGAWWPTGSPYTGGADMPLTSTDVNAVVAGVKAMLMKGGVLADLNTQTEQLQQHFDPQLAAVLAAVQALGTGPGGTVSKADVLDIINSTTLKTG